MAATMQVDIVSAEAEIFSGEATMIIASAELGEVGIAPGHTPLITRIRPGEIRVQQPEGGEELDIYASGGICLLYTSPSPRDATLSRMPSSA